MARTGKCPHCDRVLPHIEIEAIDIIGELTPKYHGTSLVCPQCRKVLQVELTPIAEEQKPATVKMQKLTGV